MFIFVSLVLSFSILIWAGLQGARRFGSMQRSSDRIRRLADSLRDCLDGGSFQKALSEHMDETDAMVRGVVRDLERPFRGDPVQIMGRKVWIADFDSICDGKRCFRRHREFGRVESMPGILTGIGILLTFLGLTVGVFGLDPTDAEQLTDSVKKLLGGMSLAFLTSIAGIGAALWWTWQHRDASARFDLAFGALAEVLHDKVFLMLPEEISACFVTLEARQTQALDQLEHTVHRAFVRALDQSGLSELKALMTPDGDEATAVPLGPVLSDIRQELKQLAARSAEAAEVNRKLNKAVNFPRETIQRPV